MDDVGIGHNSAESSIAADQLKAFVERIEKVETEVKDLQGDIKDIYAELKGSGFDPKVVRRLVRERRKSHEERQEEAAIYELYAAALGHV